MSEEEVYRRIRRDGGNDLGDIDSDSGDFVPPPSVDLDLPPPVPLTAPGLPPPGPDFIAAAVAAGDDPPTVVRDGGSRQCIVAGPELTNLYHRALYDNHFWMQVKTRIGPRTAQYILGHLWASPAVAGPRPARVMLLGKWPGQDEANAGRNFNPKGVSTAFFLETIHKYFGANSDTPIDSEGPLGTRNWYVTNVVRHPNADVTGDRLAANWKANCLPLLHMELRLVKPDYILCLGSEAATTLLGDGLGVNATAGKVFDLVIPLHESSLDVPRVHQAKVVTCVHPAAVSRKPEMLSQLVDGLRNFARLLHGTRVAAEVRQQDHRVIYHARDLEKIVDMVHADPEGDKIAVDCEWHGTSPHQKNAYLRTIQFSHKPGFAACVVLYHDMEYPEDLDWTKADDSVLPHKAFGPSHQRCQELLSKLFYGRPDGRKVRIIGHNFKADLQWLIPWGLDLRDLCDAPLDDPNCDADPEALPGWMKTIYEGGFDTMLAAHAVQETADFKLEILCNRLLGVERWDSEVARAKKKWCEVHKLKDKDLEGYGPLPGSVLFPYAMEDVDQDRALFDVYNREGGLLDKDQFGQSSRLPFWISMRANLAFMEMECQGILVDRARVDDLTNLYMRVYDRLLTRLRTLANWASFNAFSALQCRTLLFGQRFSGARDKDGNAKNILDDKKTVKVCLDRPINCLSLRPIKTTGKPPQPWERIRARQQTHLYTPGTDKESLGILRAQAAKSHGADSDEEKIVDTLRSVRFIGRTLMGVLDRPNLDDSGEAVKGGEGYMDYEAGLVSNLQDDGRIHTHLWATKETGRLSSSKPPLQNLSSKREADYEAILKSLGEKYEYPLRSVLTADVGHLACEHDLAGAELLMMAVQSGDEAMIDHCQRNVLPDEGFDEKGQPHPKGKFPHPNYYDIHSSIAVQAFKLVVNNEKASQALKLPVGAPCPPTKGGLKAIGKANLRKAAKCVVFGIPYGRGDEAIIRAVEEEGVKISTEEADLIRQAIFGSYPNLEPYLAACRERVTHPGYMVNCFGRRRRFAPTTDKQARGEMERQAGNFGIQGGVADYVSRAVDLFYNYPGRVDEKGYRYKLALQIHDAVLAMVRIDSLEWWLEEVVPACMTKIPFFRCDLDGNKVYDQPYYMGCGREIMTSWGVPLTRKDGVLLGVPEKYLPYEEE